MKWYWRMTTEEQDKDRGPFGSREDTLANVDMTMPGMRTVIVTWMEQVSEERWKSCSVTAFTKEGKSGWDAKVAQQETP